MADVTLLDMQGCETYNKRLENEQTNYNNVVGQINTQIESLASAWSGVRSYNYLEQFSVLGKSFDIASKMLEKSVTDLEKSQANIINTDQGGDL